MRCTKPLHGKAQQEVIGVVLPTRQHNVKSMNRSTLYKCKLFQAQSQCVLMACIVCAAIHMMPQREDMPSLPTFKAAFCLVRSSLLCTALREGGDSGRQEAKGGGLLGHKCVSDRLVTDDLANTAGR